MKKRSLLLNAALLIAVLGCFQTSTAQSAENVRRCADRSATNTSPTIYAPKKAAAGRWFVGKYFIHPNRKVDVSNVSVFLDSPATGKTVWKNQRVRGSWDFQLSMKDKRTQFRVEWIEAIEVDGTRVACRNSIGTWIKPWVGFRMKIKMRPTYFGADWRFFRRKELCAKAEFQVTSQPYTLRVRGANGNLRVRVPDICEWQSKIRGKRSGKWSLEFSEFDSAFNFYSDFGRRDVGDWRFHWSLFRGQTRIQFGEFLVRVTQG